MYDYFNFIYQAIHHANNIYLTETICAHLSLRPYAPIMICYRVSNFPKSSLLSVRHQRITESWPYLVNLRAIRLRSVSFARKYAWKSAKKLSEQNRDCTARSLPCNLFTVDQLYSSRQEVTVRGYVKSFNIRSICLLKCEFIAQQR